MKKIVLKRRNKKQTYNGYSFCSEIFHFKSVKFLRYCVILLIINYYEEVLGFNEITVYHINIKNL